MLNNIKMSIVIPTHGRIDLFEKTLLSALGQTCDSYEIIVSDDSSLESEREQIRNLIEQNDTKGIVEYVFTKENLLQAPNTNQGLKAARGEYVRILHSDDLLSPNCVSREIELFTSYPDVDVVYHNALPFTDKVYFNEHEKFENVPVKSRWLDDLIFVCTALPSTMCFKKSLIEKIGLLDEKYRFVCDWEFWFRLLLHEHKAGHDILAVPAGYVGWRNHEESITSTMSLTLFHEHIDFFNKLLEIYKEEQLLEKHTLKEKQRVIEDSRYSRILDDHKKHKNFVLPRIPMSYVLRHPHEYNKYLGRAAKSFMCFMSPFCAIAKWTASPFAFVFNMTKFIIKKDG